MTDDSKLLKDGLSKLKILYEVGDYKEAKILAKTLIGEYNPQGAERHEIDRILQSTRTDPGAIVAFLITLGLLVFLYIKYAT